MQEGTRPGSNAGTVRIRDVARAAGVSPATVSRVLNNTADVSPERSERVRKAVEELSYRPNGAARSLRTKAARVLGLVISDITNPFFTSLVRGVEDAAQASGYSVILANSDENIDKETSYLQVAASEQLSGVVLSPASATRSRVDLLRRHHIPVVTIDRRVRDRTVDSVTIDNRAAGREATEYLLGAGCRRVAIITGPRRTSTATGRLAGYRQALKAAGRQLNGDLVTYSDFRIEGGYAETAQLLRQRPRPDGLLVANNLMTVGAVHALEDAGLSCPDDLAVVGFDDMSWALGRRAGLALVSQPTYDIGHSAASLLLRRVGKDSIPTQHLVLPATLLIPGERAR